MSELWARIKYNWLCLVLKDGAWDMGAELVCGVLPLQGRWLNDRGLFEKYRDAAEPPAGREVGL